MRLLCMLSLCHMSNSYLLSKVEKDALKQVPFVRCNYFCTLPTLEITFSDMAEIENATALFVA